MSPEYQPPMRHDSSTYVSLTKQNDLALFHYTTSYHIARFGTRRDSAVSQELKRTVCFRHESCCYLR